MTRSRKTQLVKARVSQAIKDAVTAAATDGDVSEGAIVRKALSAYFAADPPAAPEQTSVHLAEEPTPPGPPQNKPLPKKIGFSPTDRRRSRFHRVYHVDSAGQMPPHNEVSPRDIAQG